MPLVRGRGTEWIDGNQIEDNKNKIGNLLFLDIPLLILLPLCCCYDAAWLLLPSFVFFVEAKTNIEIDKSCHSAINFLVMEFIFTKEINNVAWHLFYNLISLDLTN